MSKLLDNRDASSLSGTNNPYLNGALGMPSDLSLFSSFDGLELFLCFRLVLATRNVE